MQLPTRIINVICCAAMHAILMLFASTSTIHAQLPNEAAVYFSYLSINEGLSSNTVRALLQDKHGYIWVGTSRGVNRYDGHQVVQYPKTRALTVTAMCEVGDSIWIGTENGLYLYSQCSDSVICFKNDNKKIRVSSLNISNLSADKDGNLWIATMDQGIVKVSRGGSTIEKISTPNGDSVYGCIYVDNVNNVWATTNWSLNPIVKYERTSNRFVPYVLDFGSQQPVPCASIALTQGEDGYMWLATAQGSIIRFNSANRVAVIEASAEKTHINNAHSIKEIKTGFFVVGSDNGLSLYSSIDSSVRHHQASDVTRGALSDNFVYPIISDRETGTWVGTYYGGINYFHPSFSDFTSYVHSPFSNSISGSVINHFCEDNRGRIWIASDDGGLSVYDPNADLFHSISFSLHGTTNVHALCLYGDKMFVGTYAQGMDIVDVNTFSVTHIPALVDAKGNKIDASSYEMYADRQSRLWVGTFNDICLYEEKTNTFRLMKKVNSPIVDILQTQSGNVWFATEASGVWCYSNRSSQWKQYAGARLNAGTGDMPQMANTLFEDTNGTLWVGTSDGLLRYDAKEDKFVDVKAFESVSNVLGIEGDGDNLWLATNVGLCRFSISSEKIDQVFKGGNNIVSTDFLPAAILRSKSGEIYVGTTHGFLSFRPTNMHHNEVVPKVMFTGLEVLNRPVEVGSEILPISLNYLDELRLSYRENVIRISYSAMSYLHPSDNVYSYYLEGFDEDWLNAGNHHSITYTNLAPGTYILHVRATNNDGLLSPDTTLRIVITPPFYWNTTAQVIYLLLVLALIYYVVRRLMKKAEKRHVAEIHEINTRKEQEIQEINIQKEQEIKEINTQKEQEIQEINTQKEQEIQEINILKEQEVHDARIKFMTITPRDQEFLDKLEEIIEQNFSNPDLTVDQIASSIGISRTGLFTKLKSLADVTPNEMIQVIRLKHAAALLQENRYRVSEVCYMVGFSSPSYFSKCFQKQYGVTPAKYV